MFSGAHLLHSQDFVERIKSLGNLEGRMISLDVTALFTNVPLEFVSSKLKEKFDEGIFSSPIDIDCFLELIRLCVSSTVFSFNNEGYKQKFGVAMGSPLSPILANLCMEFIENDILENCPVHLKPAVWLRYVDDIFIIFKGTQDQFDEFFNYVNSFLPSIQFTVEYEVDYKLPFLDVMVRHNPLNQSFEFAVYRKPTNSESYIHFYSFHSEKIKSNVIVNFVIRAYRICDPQFLDTELLHIRKVFKKLCYPEHFIDKAFTRAKRQIYNPVSDRSNSNNQRFLSIPFHPSILPLQMKINRNMKEDINVVFKFENTIRKKLVRNKTEDETNKEIGVYEIPCKECNLKYYGETGRNLDVRTGEHKTAYILMAKNNVLVKHSWDMDHRIDWDATKIIYKSKNVGHRRLVEGAAINLGYSMEGNKAFTQEDKFMNTIICQKFIKDFKFRENSLSCVTPDAVAVSSPPTQVTGLQIAPSVAGAHADSLAEMSVEATNREQTRRSRRLAGLPQENDGIT